MKSSRCLRVENRRPALRRSQPGQQTPARHQRRVGQPDQGGLKLVGDREAAVFGGGDHVAHGDRDLAVEQQRDRVAIGGVDAGDPGFGARRPDPDPVAGADRAALHDAGAGRTRPHPGDLETKRGAGGAVASGVREAVVQRRPVMPGDLVAARRRERYRRDMINAETLGEPGDVALDLAKARLVAVASVDREHHGTDADQPDDGGVALRPGGDAVQRIDHDDGKIRPRPAHHQLTRRAGDQDGRMVPEWHGAAIGRAANDHAKRVRPLI